MKSIASSRTTTLVGIAFVAVVLASLAWWFLIQSKIEPEADSSGLGSGLPELTSGPAVVLESEEDSSDVSLQRKTARPVVYNDELQEDSEVAQPLDTSKIMESEVADFATEVIEKGLAGDVLMAGSIRNLTEICAMHVPKDAEGLERNIKRAMWMAGETVRAGNTIPDEGRPWMQGSISTGGPSIRLFSSEEQYRKHIVGWQQQCESVNATYTEQMREELEQLARDGHVMARYMYAMWQPQFELDEFSLEESLQWQMNAAEFTYANVEQGEPVGFLAFGQSYVQALFTPQNMRLAQLMLSVAYQCGYEDLPVMHIITRYEEDNTVTMLEGNLGLSRDRYDELTSLLTKGCQ